MRGAASKALTGIGGEHAAGAEDTGPLGQRDVHQTSGEKHWSTELTVYVLRETEMDYTVFLWNSKQVGTQLVEQREAKQARQEKNYCSRTHRQPLLQKSELPTLINRSCYNKCDIFKRRRKKR